jgi:hypothetical protein
MKRWKWKPKGIFIFTLSRVGKRSFPYDAFIVTSLQSRKSSVLSLFIKMSVQSSNKLLSYMFVRLVFV